MAWYAYCVTEKQAFPELLRHRKPIPLESVVGVDGNQTFLYPASDLAVIVSEHVSPGELDPRIALEHARVISECFKVATVLPFRFGTVFSDDEALRKSVRSNHRQFSANIERLRGKTEMRLKVMLEDCGKDGKYRPCSEAQAAAGKAYLAHLRETATLQRERQTKARSVSVQMARMFTPLEEEVSCRRVDAGKMLLDIAHLIDTRNVERYQNKYSSALQRMKDCQMQLSGPWPPYHFVHRPTRSHSSATA